MKIRYIFNKSHIANATVMFHAHSFYEINFYFSGKGKTFIGQKINNNSPVAKNGIMLFPPTNQSQIDSFDFGENFISFIEPYTVHSDIYYSDSDLICIGFNLNDDEIKVYDKIKQTAVFSVKISDIFYKIKTELETKKTAYMEIICSYIHLALSNILRHNDVKTDTSDYMSKFKHYIDEYFMMDINISEIAKQAGYCLDHFIIKFKQAYGITPKQYLINLRINYAKQLISLRNQSLTEIAQTTGFSSYPQFSKIFQKVVGVSPKIYREKTFPNT